LHKSSEIGTDYNTNILLASASVFAFAGAAAAEVTFSGDATLGYNDEAAFGNDGFYWEGNVAVSLSQELDNGLTAGATFDWNIDNHGSDIFDDGDNHTSANNYVLFIESDTAAMRFGNLDPVAEDNWGGVDGSAYDGFNDRDTHFDTVGFDAMLVGEITYGGVDGMISYGVDMDTTNNPLDALQLYVSSDFGGASVELAYQQAVAGTDEILGLGVSTTLGGADLGLAFVNATSGQSIGLDVAYPVGPATLGGYFTSNNNDSDAYGVSVDYADGPITVSVFYDNNVDNTAEDYGIEGSYDVGNGLMLMAGVTDAGDDIYVAGNYDLGGGAALLVSYADDKGGDSGDEIGDPEYQDGTTVEVSFEF